MLHRLIGALALALVGACGLSANTSAQTWPARQVTLVVPNAAGGGTDTIARLIADQLSIGEATVKSHVTNILSKLGANDRAHAVTIGLKRGIIEL